MCELRLNGKGGWLVGGRKRRCWIDRKLKKNFCNFLVINGRASEQCAIQMFQKSDL